MTNCCSGRNFDDSIMKQIWTANFMQQCHLFSLDLQHVFYPTITPLVVIF